MSAPPPAPTAGEAAPLTVTQLTLRIKEAVEQALPATVHVVGEISNFKHATSGHWYFTLKDSHSELACVLWRSDAGRVKFTPQDGLAVVATGRVEVYERTGRCQLYVRKLEPRGQGALELALQQLRDRLAKEGLFDPAHKVPLPAHPQRVAVVTSPTGAAVRDILRTLQRRYPCLRVLLVPVRVQGTGAAEEIARAIERVNAEHQRGRAVDVLIVGRGGGSIEDLWAFNEEPVVRAIFASRVPVVSAVGHEVDFTLADQVADVRAATPTAAAELVVPVRAEVLAGVAQLASRLRHRLAARLTLEQTRLERTLRRSALAEPRSIVRHRAQACDDLAQRVPHAWQAHHHERSRHLQQLAIAVQRIAPHTALRRGQQQLSTRRHHLERALRRRLRTVDRRLLRVRVQLQQAHPARRLPAQQDRVRRALERLTAAVAQTGRLKREQLGARAGRLEALSYRSVLKRGFSITRLAGTRKVLRAAAEARPGQRITTELADGELTSVVRDPQQPELFD